MQYEQAPPPDNQRGRGGDQGCLMGCIAALCCCCAIEEGCECWYVAFQSQTLPPFSKTSPPATLFAPITNTMPVSIFANASFKLPIDHIRQL